MTANLQAVVMPKWGLAMQEGTLSKWLVAEGAAIKPGVEICEIETSKITNALESTVAGTLRRRVADEGALLPVGALLGVVSDGAADDAAIDAFIASFQEAFATAAAAASSEAAGPETINVGSRTIRYQRVGSAGSAVVFIHGFGGDLNGWMFNQPVLATSHATYAIDLPGHGGSTKEVGDGSVGFFAEIVTGLLDALEVDRAHLVGHSLGGAIAGTVAAKHPARVDALTLISSAGLGPELNMGFIESFIAANGRKEILPALQKLVADPALITRDMVNETLKYKRLDGVEAALRTIAQANFGGGAQRPRIGDGWRAGLPVQVIFGALDHIIPASHAQALAGKAKVHVLAGAGHIPHIEKPGDVNGLIEALEAGKA